MATLDSLLLGIYHVRLLYDGLFFIRLLHGLNHIIE